jgi:hypothetical protein
MRHLLTRYVLRIAQVVFLRLFDLIHLVIQAVIIIGYLAYVFVLRGRKGLEELAHKEVADHLKCSSNGTPRK